MHIPAIPDSYGTFASFRVFACDSHGKNRRGIQMIVVIIEWLDHTAYERRFGY